MTNGRLDTAPSFQMYPRDFLSSPKVRRMTLEQVGAYMTLLLYQWQDGKLQMDDLADYLGVDEAKALELWSSPLGRCFKEVDGEFWNERMERERLDLLEHRERMAAGGRKSGETRRRKAAEKAASKGVEAPSKPLEPPPLPTPPLPTPPHPERESARAEESLPPGAGLETVPAPGGVVDRLRVGGGFPDWVFDVLARWEDYTLDPEVSARPLKTPQQAAALAQKLVSHPGGKDVVEAALTECMAADGKTIQGYLRMLDEQKARADRAQNGFKDSEEKRRDRIMENLTAAMQSAPQREAERLAKEKALRERVETEYEAQVAKRRAEREAFDAAWAEHDAKVAKAKENQDQ